MEPVRPLGLTPSKELLTATITIIGTGNMAHAIGGVLADGGASVQYVGHGENTPVQGDIVILAVPYPAVDDVLATYGDRRREAPVDRRLRRRALKNRPRRCAPPAPDARAAPAAIRAQN